MCALYTLQTTRKQIREALQSTRGQFPDSLEGRYTPFSKAPILVSDQKTKEWMIRDMNFSLIASWSKEKKPKDATYNCRLKAEDGTPIFKKPVWRDPFARNHCLVPITKFIEPIYKGELAGNMVRFFSEELLLAAGISDTWVDKNTGEVIDSFSIITSDPVEFVKAVGHDRTPLFIAGSAAQEWLDMKTEPQHMVDFLLENRHEPKAWQTEIDRALKPGWEKRAE